MRKFFKRKNPEAAPRIELDMPALINKMQEQLASLENKIDTLISRTSERPSEEKHFSKPFQRFDRPNRYGQGRRDNRPGDRSFTKAICADCKKECEVPFKPSGGRPVYCRECFSKRNEGSSFKGQYDNKAKEGDFSPERHFDKKQSSEKRRFGKRPQSGFRKRRERV